MIPPLLRPMPTDPGSPVRKVEHLPGLNGDHIGSPQVPVAASARRRGVVGQDAENALVLRRPRRQGVLPPSAWFDHVRPEAEEILWLAGQLRAAAPP